jgi:hypothetical protein
MWFHSIPWFESFEMFLKNKKKEQEFQAGIPGWNSRNSWNSWELFADLQYKKVFKNFIIPRIFWISKIYCISYLPGYDCDH